MIIQDTHAEHILGRNLTTLDYRFIYSHTQRESKREGIVNDYTPCVVYKGNEQDQRERHANRPIQDHMPAWS